MEHERILHILDYLTRSTDQTRAVSMRDILKHLENQSNLQQPSALTVRRDIDRLIMAGHDIRIDRGAHNTFYYRLASRKFTFNEIRFIVDSISINKFLSDKQKHQLIKKFEVFCSEAEIRRLISRVALEQDSSPSTDLLQNLDQVHDLIAAGVKINFEYGKYDTAKKMQFYKKSRDMIPCKVVYSHERFYLRCVDESTGEERTYRIDRMRNITPGEKAKHRPALKKPEGALVDIFEPDRYETVTLRVQRVLLDDMLEQFGKYAFVLPESDSDWVQLRVRIGINRSFYRWVMHYGESIEVIAPADIRAKAAEHLRRILTKYEDTATVSADAAAPSDQP